MKACQSQTMEARLIKKRLRNSAAAVPQTKQFSQLTTAPRVPNTKRRNPTIPFFVRIKNNS